MTAATIGWRNWGGTQRCTPARVESPTDAVQIAELVGRARAEGRRIKAVGAGHSFSAIAVADDIQLDLTRMRGLIATDVETDRATLRGGTHLHEIPRLLAPFGLAMTNLGDVDRQTISGATSTGTHGTGAAFGGISTQIVGATIITGTGEVRVVDEHDPDLAAVALGLGSLGVLADLTLALVPAFHMRAQETPMSADDAIAGFAERTEKYDHHEFYWFPHTNRALAKMNTRLGVEEPCHGPGHVRRWVDDELLSNKLFGALCAVGARVPATVPPIAQIAGRALSARTFTDTSTGVFISARDVRFREMEYAVPLDTIPEVLDELRTMIDRRRYRISFPVEVRAAAEDDLMLSTAAGRTSGYVAVHRYHRDDPADSASYFADVEAIMSDYDGRPHWGKMHNRDAGYLRTVYPRFDEFRAVRDRYDPDRVFANPYLEQILGP